METRSNHILVGSVVLALLAVVLIFIVWLARLSGGNEQLFDIFFKQSVDGLAKGSSVTFSGVPVGQIKEIVLMPDQPEFVRVRISVNGDTPILQGTTATIAGVGFTGVSQINLDGAIKGQPPIACPDNDRSAQCPHGVPVIPTKPGALGELLNSAPELMERLSTLTERLGELVNEDNQRSVGHILANLERLTGSLAQQGPEIGQVLADTRVAIRQAGDAAEQIGKLAATTNGELQPIAADLRRTVQSAERSMNQLEGAIGDARPGLKAFSTQTIPEVSQLVRDLTEMSEALTGVAGKLDRGGAGAVLGGNKLPDYEPK
ncbi:phospholipid/cholesterol/gamma-HCH transport system substrate-binding protein [Sphingomonas laterariae]|uniref:Phospholipid/cholesterol/gamma-HCH transport system substrate-binding protein n=1 Tax=Edaphosphingomonas laterariae TaxID=861865 RepID=A0A239FIS5_9SPHN|nr:MlaD family protein [Sphingomonas laterariae]SNS56438.1 phospholipid/cholesterol/gamma-HCH transport system substrate-binding protein [Sphingomonas laterariae]